MYIEGVFRQGQEDFGKIKVLITKSTDARGILKPQSIIPRKEGGLGFLIITRAKNPNPWASVLLVLEVYYKLDRILTVLSAQKIVTAT